MNESYLEIENDSNNIISDSQELSRMSFRKNSQQKFIEELRQQSNTKKSNEKVENEQQTKMEVLLKKAEQYANYLLTRSKIIQERRNKQQQNVQRVRGRKDQSIQDSGSNIESDNEDYPTRLEKQPSQLQNGLMKEFQLLGLNWMISLYESGINGILADEMGLGKTIQSISMIGFLLSKNIKGPFLVVGPKSTLGNWSKEFQKWLPQVRVVKLIALKEEREKIIKNDLQHNMFDVCMTSYEGVNICINSLKHFKWRFTVIDEAHRLKNDESLLSKNVRKLASDFIILLTGTPLQNNLHELWSLLNFLMPQIFDESEIFDNNFFIQQQQLQQKQEEKDLMMKQLHSILRPFMLRRTKKEVDSSIPPKKEIYIYTGLSKIQIDLYKNLLLKKSTNIENNQTNKNFYNNLLMQIRKVCNHPYIFENVEDQNLDPLGEHLVQNAGKLVVTDQLLKKLSDKNNEIIQQADNHNNIDNHNRHQVLIFSQMTKMLDILEDYCNIRGYQYCRIDGDTDMYSRDQQIQEFTQPNSGKFVFLLSTRAGGLGINLATADTVILYDSDWNPQIDLQAMDRAHRIGQKKQVNVYRLITENSIEEKIIERQIVKLKWDNLVIQQNKQLQNKSNITKEQLREIIQFGAQEIFKAENGTISDQKLEELLERGQNRIHEYQNSIQNQMNNIMDLSMNQLDLYQFQNENYHQKKLADQEVINQKIAEEIDKDLLLRTRREKKIIYNEDEIQIIVKHQKQKQQKQIRIGEHQLYSNKERLVELLQKQANGKLNDDEENEKNEILDTGFNWNKEDYNNFIRGCEKYGKNNLEVIQQNYLQNKGVDEIREYRNRFFQQIDNLSEKDNILKRIERGQKQQTEKQLIQQLIHNKCIQYQDVLDELDFSHCSGYRNVKNNYYQLIHDRCILYYTWKYGFGEWDLITKNVKNEKINRFDSFIRTRNSQDINKRLNKLVKIIQKELEDVNPRKSNNYIDLNKAKNELNQQKTISINQPLFPERRKQKKQLTLFQGFNKSINQEQDKQSKKVKQEAEIKSVIMIDE